MKKYIGKTVGIIGAGSIGLNLAEILALQGYNVIIYNRRKHGDPAHETSWLAKQGFVMDLLDSLQLPECGDVMLTDQVCLLNDLDVIVITAGAKRQSSSDTRESLAIKNAKILDSYLEVAINNPQARVLIVTNPVDFLTQYFLIKLSQVSSQDITKSARRVFGVSYIDSMRLQNIVKESLSAKSIDYKNYIVEGIAIGEHGPAMVPLISTVKVNNQPLSNFFSQEEILSIIKNTILRGDDIIRLTGQSSVTGPAHAAMYMINKLMGKESIVVCSAWDGARCIGSNVVFKDGYMDYINNPSNMTEHERALLEVSRQKLDSQYSNLIQNLAI